MTKRPRGVWCGLHETFSARDAPETTRTCLGPSAGTSQRALSSWRDRAVVQLGWVDRCSCREQRGRAAVKIAGPRQSWWAATQPHVSRVGRHIESLRTGPRRKPLGLWGCVLVTRRLLSKPAARPIAGPAYPAAVSLLLSLVAARDIRAPQRRRAPVLCWASKITASAATSHQVSRARATAAIRMQRWPAKVLLGSVQLARAGIGRPWWRSTWINSSPPSRTSTTREQRGPERARQHQIKVSATRESSDAEGSLGLRQQLAGFNQPDLFSHLRPIHSLWLPFLA
jgi:hypothetical protein